MINLLFSGNSAVFDGILTTMLSIYNRTSSKEPICAYVLTMDVSHLKKNYVPINRTQLTILKEVARRHNPENDIVLIRVDDLYKQYFAGCPNEGAYCSPYTLLRLFSDLIKELPDKILYLDMDLMFNRDITLLYNIDVREVEYAAARDHYGKYILNPNYVNAGVILFNLKKCKQTGLLSKARKLIQTKKLTFADQSALIRSTSKKKMLPQKFNDQKFLHQHTVVRHFSKRLFYFPYPHTDNIKQWHIEKVHKVFKYHQFDDIYDEYINIKNEFNI